MHLTDLSVRALKPNGRTTYYWDSATPGFGVRVGKRKKTFTIIRGENRERITIGHYGDLSLSEARAEAKRLLSASPEEKAPLITFEKAKAEFLYENYKDASPRTAYEAARHLGKHFKALHTTALHTITDADIKKQLDRISARAERLHAYRYARCFLKWCTRPPR
ncbi:MAG TPA: Arm DNA-binding domain-containing protein, partial [Micropepsaceae bacterium]|nr:Arm DNA-binding domain-containing protein [Micropepsaceae bacterium]